MKGSSNILDYFTTNDQTSAEINITKKTHYLNNYMKLVHNTTIDRDKKDKLKLCNQCGIEKSIFRNEGICVCERCGETESLVIEPETISNTDNLHEIVFYPYKRTTHLRDILHQFQAKECINISDSDLDTIRNELKKQRITNNEKITVKCIRNVLKKLKMQDYYDHVVYIVTKLTNRQPPILTRETEEKIKYMFKQIQEPFVRHCPTTRTNFLSYSFVLHKIFQILEIKHADYFKVLKSKRKLGEQESIWTKICNDLGWPIYS